MKRGVYLLLHPFVVQVLDYFDIVPFLLPLNSHRLIVAFSLFSQSTVVSRLQCSTSRTYMGSRPLLSMRDLGI